MILKTGGKLQLPESRIQHFLNFSPLKQPETIRIGAFGDSHTFGHGVKKTESYPYQLQRLFNTKFQNKKIEVLNFGLGGVSFQEQFFLWEKYAKNYALDYILLGPHGFYPNRDVTFRKNFNLDRHHLFYPKTRFVLSRKNRLKQVHIKGDTLKERYKNYYTLIPSWRALHYDKRPFQIWESLFPILRYGIKNPFYYKKMSDRKESARINILLLERIKGYFDKKILFFTDKISFFEKYQTVDKLYNLNFIPFPKSRFYSTFLHKSSLGNEWIANIYFKALIGQKNFSVKTINCYFEEFNFFRKTRQIFNKDLDAVQSIQITDGHKAISTLRYNLRYYPHKRSYLNHKISGTKSFIAFFNQHDFLGSPIFPLPVQLKEGMKIYIQLENKNKIKLGSIETLDISEKFFVFYGKYMRYHRTYHLTKSYQSYFLLEKMPFSLKKKMEKWIVPEKWTMAKHYFSYSSGLLLSRAE